MRLVYLCKADPPPPMSDFHNVLEYFKSLPEYLHPRTRENDSKHILYFADRVGDKWITEFHDFAIAFVSGRFLADEKAMQCLAYASKAFPNIVCIDLYDNLTLEQKEMLKKYTVNIFSAEEGKNFLVNTFYDEDAVSKQEAEKIEKSIETDGYTYLDGKIKELEKTSKRNSIIANICYIAALLVLIVMVVYVFCNNIELLNETETALYNYIYKCVKTILLSGLMIAITRYLFMLGKSFMVEAIRISDRAHAIGLGKLYLQLYKSKFEWTELKDVLQNWNIDSGSAFINLDAKDIENVSVEKVVSVLKDKK